MSSNRSAAETEKHYDVCLSFAGEQRPYVAGVARHLLASGVRVFYDDESILDSSCGAGIIDAVFSILNEDRCAKCIEDAIAQLDFGFLARSTMGHDAPAED